MDYTSLILHTQQSTEELFNSLEVNTENINNSYTTGYKAKRLNSFGDVLKDMQTGKLMISNDKNDVALEGPGFFLLSDEDEKPVMARTLRLEIDKNLYLKSEGKLVYPKTQLTQHYPDIEVKQDGKIYGKKTDGTKTLLTTLRVVNFPAADKLDFDGYFYRPTKESGDPMEIKTGITESAKIRQQYVEGSNVDSPLEFAKFSRNNAQLRILTSIYQLLHQTRKSHISSLGQIAQQ